jgi:hypothetical protein
MNQKTQAVADLIFICAPVTLSALIIAFDKNFLYRGGVYEK